MVEVDISIIFAGLSIAVSIVYYASVLRNANLQQEKDFIYQRISTVNAEFYINWRKLLRGEWRTFNEYMEYLEENPDYYGIFTQTTTMLSSVGLLLKQKAIDPELLFSLYTPNSIIWTWEKAKPLIEVWREAMNYPEQYSGFEYLYNEAKKRYPDVHSVVEYVQTIRDLTGNPLAH